MIKADLVDLFNAFVTIQPAAKITYLGSSGIAVRLSVNLSERWQAGDIVVFWANGDITALPDEFDLVNRDLFRGPTRVGAI